MNFFKKVTYLKINLKELSFSKELLEKITLGQLFLKILFTKINIFIKLTKYVQSILFLVSKFPFEFSKVM